MSMAVWGYIAIWASNKMGNGTIAKILNKYFSVVAGVLFIGLAFRQIL